MKLSKEVVDLESIKKLNFYEEYERITSLDPEFAKIIEYYENKIIEIANQKFGTIELTNKAGENVLLLPSDQVMRLFHSFALNIHRLMEVQAEIDIVERECGTKED